MFAHFHRLKSKAADYTPFFGIPPHGTAKLVCRPAVGARIRRTTSHTRK
ncbi:hypothetical protein NEIELOOT_01247 [Neisseria elongata subsp. glycolytica ATCC 29315]|uniref:Uncharacterized protein n=1 Tax=Neisseria elongata subsp. glycolytica ATCC 29315 TaxID=546263 RepID=D4DQB1_NEIEG|nr:hypothetical protein NEIELOOT_01247 [Neisseria elongata subsp. glycolytica ATCC 29315]